MPLHDHPRSKVAKDSVDYSPGMDGRFCRVCVHFEKPAACERVRGEIDPAYWCKLFKKKA